MREITAKGTEGWTFLGDGEWSVKDGVLRQTSEKQKLRALVGDPAWTDCTIELKARKLAGRLCGPRREVPRPGPPDPR